MNLMKNSKNFLQKSKWLSVGVQKTTKPSSNKIYKKKVHTSRIDLQNPLPPIVKNDLGQEDSIPMKSEKVQKDIFGATILPPNLSFENSKRLTDNQIKLEDIPIVDESDAAEELAAQKMRILKGSIPREMNTSKEEFEIFIVNSDIMKNPCNIEKSQAELFWVADSYENIPGPNLFQSVFYYFKLLIRQVTVVSLFKFFKKHALTPFRMYGPIVKLPEILGGKILLISRSDHIAEILKQDQSYPISSILESVQKSRLIYRNNNNINCHLTEPEWEDMRKTLNEPQTKGIDRYFDDIEECCNKFITRIKAIRNKQNEVPEDFLFELNKWSLECLCILIFEKSFGFLDYKSSCWPSKTSQLLHSLTNATSNLCKLETGFQLWRFINTMKLSSLGSTCHILESIIAEHVAQVQVNLIKRKEKEQGSIGNVSLVEGLLLQDILSPNDIITIILDTLLIGMNTMSSSLAFLLYHLSQNPQTEAKVHKELKKVLPEVYSRLEYKHLAHLNYLKACIKDSVRLKMPMPVLSRILSKNVTLSNYQIPKGTFILMAAQAEGVKEEYFEEPTKFIPERWLENENNQFYMSLPLGSLEKRVIETSILACSALILRHFMIEYLYGDLESTSTVLALPDKPLKFTLTDRKT